MYAVTLTKNEETRRFTITATENAGWEVREEQNSQLVSRQMYTDWHRVERAQMGFAHAVDSLVDEGWKDAADSAIRLRESDRSFVRGSGAVTARRLPESDGGSGYSTNR